MTVNLYWKWHIVYIPNPSNLTQCLCLMRFVRLSCCWKGGHVMCGRLLFSAHQASRSATGCKLWGGADPASVRARPRICRIFPHTHYPPAHKATHPKYFLNTAHPKHCPKPISLKQAANGYFDNGNCSNIVLRWMKRYLAEFSLNDTFSRQDLPLVTDDKARQWSELGPI